LTRVESNLGEPGRDPGEEARRRWRLVLGRDADGDGPGSLGAALDARDVQIDEVLEFLFGREYEADVYRDRQGGLGASSLSVPRWLNRVRELFPKSTAESLARTALERYKLAEVLADDAILEQVEPSMELLRSLMAVKEAVPERLLSSVRRLVRKVVDDLRRKLTHEVQRRFLGALHRRSHSPHRVSKNFDVATTLRKNLRRYEPESRRILIERAYFHSRVQRRNTWDLILLVDQSGSMTDSAIHSAVLAGIFHSLPALRTRLVVFDVEVVDLTDAIHDPVETLMRIQLGGGTDIARALTYAHSLIQNPRRTLVVLVTDFYEGGDPAELIRATARLASEGAAVLGLASLDQRADPEYDRDLARRLVEVGMHVGAMTPDRLAEWVAERVRT
jgi:Mg-chelatase subunit ChlD